MQQGSAGVQMIRRSREIAGGSLELFVRYEQRVCLIMHNFTHSFPKG